MSKGSSAAFFTPTRTLRDYRAAQGDHTEAPLEGFLEKIKKKPFRITEFPRFHA